MTRVLTPEQDRFVGVIKARVDRVIEEMRAKLTLRLLDTTGICDSKGQPIPPPKPSADNVWLPVKPAEGDE